MGNNVSVMLEKLYIDRLQRTTEKNEPATPLFIGSAQLSAGIAATVFMLYIDGEKDIYIAL